MLKGISSFCLGRKKGDNIWKPAFLVISDDEMIIFPCKDFELKLKFKGLTIANGVDWEIFCCECLLSSTQDGNLVYYI